MNMMDEDDYDVWVIRGGGGGGRERKLMNERDCCFYLFIGFLV